MQIDLYITGKQRFRAFIQICYHMIWIWLHNVIAISSSISKTSRQFFWVTVCQTHKWLTPIPSTICQQCRHFWQQSCTSSRTQRALSAAFKMTDLGETKTYLRLEVTHDCAHKTLTLCQSWYITDIIVCFGMAGCNPVATPMPPTSQLIPFKGTASASACSTYQWIVGSLMYTATVSWPDIAFVVNSLTHHTANPTPEHLTTTKHILRYLVSTINLGLFYNSTLNTTITAYSDSDWATSLMDQQLTGAFVFLLCGSVISWSSHCQCIVSLSSTEAEYIALSQATVQAM
jgi:hypothetical protein